MHVKASNGSVIKFPYSIGDLRKENPHTSFPKNPSEQMLMSWGVYRVQAAPRPAYDARTQTVTVADTPVLSGESWVLPFLVREKTPDEIASYDKAAAENARSRRNQCLKDSDWWALPDTPDMTAEQAAYRQALRDITAHANWPYLEEADWPVKPE